LGRQPAQWLSARGTHLRVIDIPFAEPLDGPLSEAFARVPRDAPCLLDTVFSSPFARDRGGRTLISIDDDYWVFAEHLSEIAGAPAFAEWLSGFEASLRAADVLVVPSVRLVERARRFGREIALIPPALPRLEDWPVPRPARTEPGFRLGWVGTAGSVMSARGGPGGHGRDLELIGPAVLKLLAQRSDVTIVLGGTCVPTWAHHPRVEIHRPGWLALPEYYRFLASLDLDAFLCPLVDDPFNRAKPCLKPLEAAGLGLPVIASRVGSYATDLAHEETALLVAESTEAWLAALIRLVEDADLRAHLAARGRHWAATRTIEQTGSLWAQLWGVSGCAGNSSERRP
jgi:glycosyltransferase involved in cell wall biosynthesis